jgi:hypothetical protein
MTLSPWTGPEVRGVGGPDYKVGARCCNPGCPRWTDHAHHVFRRTDQRLGGAFAWIEIKGVVYQNLVPVCARCHDDLTGGPGGHKAAIKLVGPDFDWVWNWCSVTSVDGEERISPLAPIEPQPLALEEFATSRASGDPVPEQCPTCGHVTMRARPTGQGRRARKSWTIKVPDDAEEDGAAVLDALTDDLGLILGVEPNQTGRYYIVVPVLYYAHQDKARFVESVKGVGG